MARPRKQGLETRARILDVALELFTQQGYDKTSLRDIAERLGITKAALYYYFERKEDILLELHMRLHSVLLEILDELEAVEDGPERVAAWPRMLNGLITGMIENRELMLLHHRNPSAMEALHDSDDNRMSHQDLEARGIVILSSPKIPVVQRVRMACSIGAITETFMESAAAFTDVEPEELAAIVRATLSDILGAPVGG